MIKSVVDNVMNDESQALARAVYTQNSDLDGVVTIEENLNSGWIYAADENGECYLFSDSKNTCFEKHVSCPNCGYENFVSNFVDEISSEDCCKEYAIECEFEGYETLKEESA